MQYEVCGPYLLLEKLASGGMAEVYLAKAYGVEGVSKYLAVKKILPQYLAHDEFISMFKTEAKIAININHVNIVPVYEFGLHNNQFYLAMEFVLGKNLRQLVSKMKKKNAVIPVEHIIFIINEVAKGLDYAHRFIDRGTGKPLNIIHRDMSPQNIMLSYEGEVKIVDFGIAKAESKLEATQAGTLKGKYGYMSPEQVEGLDLDYRTDIFSLGTILWELLANDRLFIANNEINTIKKIKACHIPELSRLNPKVDQELERITNKALTKDRSLRYQSASDLHRDLNRYLNKYFSDYTSSDFAHYVKQLYLKEIMEMREKLVSYGKIEVPRNQIINENTRTVTQTASDVATTIMPTNISVTGIDFKSQISLDKKSVIGINPATRSGVKKMDRSGTFTKSGVEYTGSFVKPKRNNFLMFASMFILAVSAYLYTNEEALSILKANLGLYNQTQNMASTTMEPERQPTKVAAIPTYNFYIKSSPSGARIYIDDKDTEFYTPGRVNVPVKQPFKLTIRKSGYLDYNKQITATLEGQQFKATLQKSNIGYVSIYVPSPNVDIYINGTKISEKPPIERYALQAAESVNIVAINPYTKARDSANVKVRKDTHQTIQLFPKK